MSKNVGSWPAPVLETMVPVQFGKIELHADPPWLAFNPSIAVDGDGYRMVVRTNNGFLRPKHKPADWVGENHAYLLFFDQDFEPAGSERIEIEVDLPVFPAHKIGPMDARIIEFGQRWYIAPSMMELSPDLVRRVVLFDLDGTTARNPRVLQGPEPGREERNWMPFVRDGALYFVYGCAPTRIFRCDPVDGSLTEVVNEPVHPVPPNEWRGGSQGVDLGDGTTLFVIHEKDFGHGFRAYLHRFVRLGPDMRVAAVSPAFSYRAKRIEFCAGAVIRNEKLLMSLGLDDRTAWLAAAPLEGVLSLLKPIEPADL